MNEVAMKNITFRGRSVWEKMERLERERLNAKQEEGLSDGRVSWIFVFLAVNSSKVLCYSSLR